MVPVPDGSTPNEVRVFRGFQTDVGASGTIAEDQLFVYYPELFKEGDNELQCPTSPIPFEKLLSGEVFLSCSLHTYISQTYKAKTAEEIIEELEMLVDQMSHCYGPEAADHFAMYMEFVLALLDCCGNLLLKCDVPNAYQRVKQLNERINELVEAQRLFTKNLSLIRNKASFTPPPTHLYSDFYTDQIRLYELEFKD